MKNLGLGKSTNIFLEYLDFDVALIYCTWLSSIDEGKHSLCSSSALNYNLSNLLG